MDTELQNERKTLSRRAVIEAALTIGDSEGADAVSLRRVARELGVTPMALYRYVESKEALLAAVADRAFEEFELPTESDDWREELKALAHSFRRLLLAHPTVATLFSSKPAEISQNGARVVEVILGVLRRAGFPPQEAALVESECERFILGLVVLEMGGGPQLCPFGPKGHHSHDAKAILALLPPEEFPNLLEALPYFNDCKDADWAFEFALELIVSGLEHQLEGAASQLESS
ncbi:MAG TPA: TetR/AcrR family transcriptional regulator [Gaiellaceae bacterium]|jgi:TetR/AcrR family transcriptional regulator, tetracycline repressor protein